LPLQSVADSAAAKAGEAPAQRLKRLAIIPVAVRRRQKIAIESSHRMIDQRDAEVGSRGDAKAAEHSVH